MIPNRIRAYFHCAGCFKDKPSNISARDWARQSIGWTKDGLQVWCNRCNASIIELELKEEDGHDSKTRSSSFANADLHPIKKAH